MARSSGIVIAYLNVPAFIGTLGLQLAVYGICLVYTNATPLGFGYRARHIPRCNRHSCSDEKLPHMFINVHL
ncbi:MAG: hypothetical protein ACLUD2_12860 [Clostridium sp.]